MASKPETTFIGSLHKYLPPDLYRMKLHNPYIGGPWDMFYSGMGNYIFAEYKFIVVPKRDDTVITPDLSPLQLAWGRGRLQEGRNLAVIVGCKDGGVIMTNLEWERPVIASSFKKRILTRAQLADWIVQKTK